MEGNTVERATKDRNRYKKRIKRSGPARLVNLDVILIQMQLVMEYNLRSLWSANRRGLFRDEDLI